MSSLPSFFRTQKPRKFHYIPRYYDPEKEAMQQRIDQVEQELGLRKEKAYVPKIRKGQMQNYFHRKSKSREKSSNIRILIILAFLLLLAYLIFR